MNDQDNRISDGNFVSGQREEAFIALLTANHKRIYGFIQAVVPHWSDADDIMQETDFAGWRADKFARCGGRSASRPPHATRTSRRPGGRSAGSGNAGRRPPPSAARPRSAPGSSTRTPRGSQQQSPSHAPFCAPVGAKSEARNPKSETNPKDQNPKAQNGQGPRRRPVIASEAKQSQSPG